MRAADFLGTIGVNTHIAWQDGASAYANQGNITKAIEYLGVKYVRDGVPYEGWTLPFYQSLAEKGVKFDLITTSTSFNETGDYSKDLGHISSLVQAVPGSVASIEGLNEVNTWTVNYQGQNTGSNLAVGKAVQALLDQQTNANPLLKDIPVLNLTVGGITAQQASVMGDMSAISDYGTWHPYFGNGDQPWANISSGVAAAKLLNPVDKVQITESNYYTAVNDMAWGGGGVTEEVQAKLDLNLLMDAAYAGVARTFLYELLDNGLTPTNEIEGSLGLFHSDGSPKQVATAIHNLTTILADNATNAASFTTGALDVSVSGLSSNGKTMLLQKADGHYQMVIWAEPDIWNEGSRTPINVASQPVTLTLGQTAGTVKVYDPMAGTSAISSAANTKAITVQVSDHPIIVDIYGTGTGTVPTTPSVPTTPTAPTAPTAPSTGTATKTIGSGSDALVLKISQDAYDGNAQYTVSVDGKQIGGTLTATALHSADVSDTITVKGDRAAGNHPVAVNFLNDA
ncbi:hypothetical protein [Siccirubricoccus soli]|nr:hypothetical protein [Siccirubricoccus soli]